MSVIDLIGYLGSVLVAVSLMMNSLVRLRWINLVGALAFSLYGLLVGAYPVFIVNGFIALVDVWYLVRMRRDREFFSLLEIARVDNVYLQYFLNFHAQDIARFFPAFDLETLDDAQVVFILRDLNPAGLVVFTEEDDAVHLHLDYALPQYRDLRCGRFFLEQWTPKWRALGLARILSPAQAKPHGAYLKRLGFRPSQAVSYERSLAAAVSD